MYYNPDAYREKNNFIWADLFSRVLLFLDHRNI